MATEKKVFRGWISKEFSESLFEKQNYFYSKNIQVFRLARAIFTTREGIEDNYKGQKIALPPKRVKITVEIEDEKGGCR